MPDILVEVRGSWLAGQQSRLLDALHTAFVGALKYPSGDKLMRLIEHAPANYAIPDGMGERDDSGNLLVTREYLAECHAVVTI